MYPFFGKLPFSVDGIFAGSIDYGLYALSVFRLFVAVPGNHVKLANVILEKKYLCKPSD